MEARDNASNVYKSAIDNGVTTHPKKVKAPGKEVKILIVPEECIFDKDVACCFEGSFVGDARNDSKIDPVKCRRNHSLFVIVISRMTVTVLPVSPLSLRKLHSLWKTNCPPFGVLIWGMDWRWWVSSTATFLTPNYRPSILYTIWYHILHCCVWRILHATQAANVFMCDSSMIPLVLSLDKLKEELRRRNIFFQESYSREMLVHLLEMDILFRSKRISSLSSWQIGVKPSCQDYALQRVTAFDVFNENYGNYTGPMLTALIKDKGITPPR